MEKHKNKALEDDCLCVNCKFRFQCFTQERVFSDPLYQGLYEALIALGRSREEALEEVTKELKFKIQPGIAPPMVEPQTFIPYIQPITIAPLPNSGGTYDNGSNINNVLVTYTMITGEEVSWTANGDRIKQLRID